jgi:xylan 1,4-beta-xylosidase
MVWMILAWISSCGRVQTDETYTNPVLVETYSSPVVGTMGIGDPAVIFYDGKYYLYPTGDNHSYYVYISTDLVHWKKGPKVFQSEESGVWAPDVLYNPPDGKFYLYYTVNKMVGVAVADRPDGVFTDLGTLVKDAIDANMFLDDDGEYYLYYVEFPAFSICVQPMGTPVRKKGKPSEIVRPAELWEMKERPIAEAPWMLKRGGTYYLLYSGGGADTADYAIGYATAKSPIGPFSKYPGNPVMKKGNGVFGPGHCAVTKSQDGRLWMIYHQKRDSSKGWDRIICIDPIWFDDKGVLHGKATRSVSQQKPFTKANSGNNRRRSGNVRS